MGPRGEHPCLLCRGDATSRRRPNWKSCATSFCAIFGLSDSHPFRMLFENAYYCKGCVEEVREADVALGKLEILKQSLLRFQTRMYSTLGDNYFQIKDVDVLDASYKEFETGGGNIRGRKFSYDEITKIVYEKIDKECFKWERFSSESRTLGNRREGANTPTDVCVQTDDLSWSGHGQQDEFSLSQSSIQAVGPENEGPSQSPNWNCEDSYDDPETVEDDVNVSQTTFGDYQPSDPVTSRLPISFDQKFNCTYADCQRYFYDDYNLQIHIKSIHLGNPKPYECADCRKSFIDEARLKGHRLRIHTSFGLYICDKCGKGCSTPAMLRDHVRKNHDLASAVHRCYFCTAPFPTSESLEEHENQHRNNESPFACLFCVEIYSNSAALKTHYSHNHAEGKYKCDLCEKLLSSENGLRLHMISHTQTYKCDSCTYTATCKSSLNNHKLSHTSERAFTCEVCGVAYKYMKNLIAHRRVHSGIKSHICKICNAAFRERAYLKRHEESHSTVWNYQCEHCDRKFKVKENLKKHLRIHNGYVKKRKPSASKHPVARKRSPAKRTITIGKAVEAPNCEIVRTPVKAKISPSKPAPRVPSILKAPSKSKYSNKNTSKTKKSPSPKTKKRADRNQSRTVELQPHFAINEANNVVNPITQEEINNAVASIDHTQGIMAGSSNIQIQHLNPENMMYPSSGMYTNDFQPTTVSAQQLDPVNTPGQYIATSRSAVQYPFGYNLG